MIVPMPQSLFNRQLLRQRRNRLTPGYYLDSKLHRYAALSLRDRLSYIKRDYHHVLIIGDIDMAVLGLPPTAHITCIEGQAANLLANSEYLPFARASFDLIISSFDLQSVNDVPGVLAQLKYSLKPDGLFQGIFLGGSTFDALQQACLLAEESVRGGVTPRVAPMISLADAAALLQRAGFGLPVADHDQVHINFNCSSDLFRMIKKCGLTNGLWHQAKGLITSQLLEEIAKQVQIRYACSSGISVPFDLIFISGWAPSAKQQQALQPGSAQYSLIEALEQTSFNCL